MAMARDPTATRLVMERISAPCKDRPVLIDLPRFSKAADLTVASANILEAVQEMRITPTEANRLMQLIEVSRRTLETEDLERRIERLKNV